MMRIRIADNKDQPAWDEYVRAHDLSGPYHLFAWREAVARAYRHSAHYLVAEDESGGIEGVFPLILVKPPFLQGYLVSLPFCDYGGPLVRSGQAAELLAKRAAELARSFKSKLEIRCKEANASLLSVSTVDGEVHKSRMVLDLPRSSALMWDSFKSKVRSQIRRPSKDGMEFRMGSNELLDDFYQVFSRNMKELGSPVHAKSWIASVLDAYAANAHVGMVYKGATPVAGGIVLDHKQTVSVPWASALSSYSKSSPNMLMYWGFLQYASDNGFSHFDFGRSTPGEGTYKFKEQWGARPEPLSWYAEAVVNDHDNNSRTGGLRTSAEAIWSRLPKVITDALGPRIRGYITL